MADTNAVLVEFGAKIDGLVAGVDEVKQHLQTLNQSAASISEGFGRLGDVIISAFSIDAIVRFVEKMGELGLQTERTMAQLGMSAGEVGMLSGMADVTGTSMQGLSLAIERMSLNVQRSTRDAVNPQSEALRVLGLNAKELIGIPTSEYFDKLHEAVSKFNPSLNLTNAVMAIGGRGVAQIIPLLQLNGEEWEKMRSRIAAAKEGLAAAIPAMADTHQQIALMSMSVESLGAAIFVGMKPAIDGVVHSFEDFSRYVKEAIKDGGALHGTFDVLTTAARWLAAAIAMISSGLLGMGVAVEGVFRLAAGDITKFEDNAKNVSENLERIGRDLKARLDEIWSEPAKVAVTKPGGGTDARAMNVGLQQAMADRLKVIENEYKLEADQISKSYGDFFFNEGAKTAALLAALQKRYDAEVAAGERTTVAYSKYALDRQKILDSANKQYEKSLNEVFSGLQGAINGQLRGMLAGTTSFAQGFKAIIGDMVIWAIQEIEKIAFKWLAHELIQTAATESGVAARTAAEAAGTESTLPLRVAKFTSDITASAAETFAGIFGNLALLMGPAAAGPAAAGSATVLANLAAAPKLDVGTNYVARTGFAMIHQGEKITPAQTSGPFTGGDGTNVHLTIQAVDAKSFANLLNANSGLLASLIKRSMRDGQMNLATAR